MEENDPWDDSPKIAKPMVLALEPYNIKEIEHVENLLTENINLLSDTLCISKDQALGVLKYFKWNSDVAQSKWFENIEKYGMECGILFNPEYIKSVGKSEILEFDPNSNMCMICFSEFTEKNPYDSLDCKHKFCKDCWKGTCESAVQKGKDCLNCTCPYAGCFMQITKSFYKKYCSDILYKKYQQFLCRSFTDDNKIVRWCPSPGCKYFAFLSSGIPEIIYCKCGFGYCPKCANETHKPINCDILRKWQEKNVNEGENYLWLVSFTKPCPNCKANIEKNGGCFYMRCQKCQHEFCWSCLRPWKEHSDHWKCNLFDSELKTNKEFANRIEKQKEAELEMKRFGFYYEKYFSHSQGLDYARKELNQIKEKQNTYSQLIGLPVAEMEFLEEAAKSIVDMRRILKYSYVLGYYMKDGPEKELFQFRQGQLEQFCDKLHQLLEMKPEEVVIDTLTYKEFFRYKSDVANYYGCCKKYYDAF